MSANRARFAADMTGLEQIQINLSGGFESFVATAAEIVPQATLYAAAIEGSISIVENSIYVYRRTERDSDRIAGLRQVILPRAQ